MIGLADHHFILVTKLVSDIAILVIPESITICRVYTCIAVDIELSERMSDYEFCAGLASFVLFDTIVKFCDLIIVI